MDDKDIFGWRFRACAFIVEYVGDRVVSFVDLIIKMLLDILIKSFVWCDVEYLMEILMIYVFLMCRMWVELMMLYVNFEFILYMVVLCVCEKFFFRRK